MKTVFLILFGFVILPFGLSQEFHTDFSDGTLEGWSNTDNSVDFLSVEASTTASGFNLQKICDGTNTPIGEMAIVNHENWVGNYFYNSGGGVETMINLDFITIRNPNNFDLHIRYGFTGANGYEVVTTEPIIVPALSAWNMYENHFSIIFPGIYNLTILTDTSGLPWLDIFNNVHDLFEDVVEVRILHSESISMDGEVVSGNLEIDMIEAFFLLSNDSQIKSTVEIAPNPSSDFILIKTNGISQGTIKVYSVLGEKVRHQLISSSQTKIDMQNLTCGIYFVTVKTESISSTKKIIKL